jgi:biuret amidohydrolase
MPQYQIRAEKCALLVIDMNIDFVEAGAPLELPSARAIAPTIERLSQACRRAGVQVIYVAVAWSPDGSDMGRVADFLVGRAGKDGKPTGCISGTRGTEIYPALTVTPSDIILRKKRYSCFSGTALQAMLASRGIDTLVITGVAANGCCESTARDAVDRDYKVIFVADAVATADLPDVGWGPLPEKQAMSALLTVMSAATAEVVSAADLLDRIPAPHNAVA